MDALWLEDITCECRPEIPRLMLRSSAFAMLADGETGLE